MTLDISHNPDIAGGWLGDLVRSTGITTLDISSCKVTKLQLDNFVDDIQNKKVRTRYLLPLKYPVVYILPNTPRDSLSTSTVIQILCFETI